MKKLNLIIPAILMVMLFSISCSKDEDTPAPAVVPNTSTNNPQQTNGSVTAIIDGVPFTSSSVTASLTYNPSIPNPTGPPTSESNVLSINASNSSATSIDIMYIWFTPQNQIFPVNMPDLTSFAGQMSSLVTFTVNGNFYGSTQSGELNILSVDTINRLVSGTFFLTATTNPPSLSHNLTNGVFTNIQY